MSTEGIEAVFIETHNWGKTAAFYQALGFTVDFETGHNSGMLRNGDGPYLFIAEVPANRPIDTRLVLKVADAKAFQPGPLVEPDGEFEPTHYGTLETTVRDPDGRVWALSAPGEESGHA